MLRARMLVAALLAGCATPHWDKPGATVESMAADQTLCAEARQKKPDGPSVADCMRAKGYSNEGRNAATSIAATYEAVLPAASGGGERHIRVMLKGDGGAAVTSTFSGRPSRFLAEGTWTHDGSRVRVSLERENLVFEHSGDLLIAREWDRAAWGEAGPGVLARVR